MEQLIEAILISVVPAISAVILEVAMVLIQRGTIKKFFADSAKDIHSTKDNFKNLVRETEKILKENEDLKKAMKKYDEMLLQIDSKLGDIIENGEEEKRLHEELAKENMDA